MFCLRVMVGVIILYDHVHPIGAFNKASTIDVSTIFFALWYECCHLWISEKLNHWNIATSWQTWVEEVQGDVVVVFSSNAQTVLPLIAFWFHIVKWKLPFLWLAILKIEIVKLSVSIFVTCLNQVYDIHALIAKEVWISLSNEQLESCSIGTELASSPQWNPIIFLFVCFPLTLLFRVDFVRFTELKHSRAKFVSVFISVKDSMWKFKCNSVACSRIYDSSCTP